MRRRDLWTGAGTRIIGVLGLTEFSRGALIIALLPAYVTGPLGASLTTVGWALSGHYFLDTVFRGPMGWLVDRIGPSKVLLIGVFIEIIALIGTMNAARPSGVIAFVALLGVGTATHWPSAVTGINRLASPDRRGSMMGLVFAAWLIGSGVGPVLINFLLHGRDRVAFLLLVLADVAAFALALGIYDPRLHRVRHPLHRTGHWIHALWPFRYLIPGMFVQTMTLGVMLPIVRPFTTGVLNLNQWQFAELLLGSGALTVLLLVPMGRLTDRWGIRFPLVGGFFVAGGALIGVAFFRGFFELVVVGGLLGLAYAMILPSWNAFLANLIPKHIEGALWGMFMTVEGLGMAVGPIIGARLFGWANWAPFVVSALILLGMGSFYWVFPMNNLIRQR